MAAENLAGPSALFPFASSLVSCASSSRCGDGKARRRKDKRSLETDVSTLPLYRTKSKQKELYCRVSASQGWVKNTSCLFLRHRLQTSRNPPYCLLACNNTWSGRLRNADVVLVPRKAGPGWSVTVHWALLWKPALLAQTLSIVYLYDALLKPRGDTASLLYILLLATASTSSCIY